jgi:RNA polymerase sigma-70 factor (ECF subfamily)
MRVVSDQRSNPGLALVPPDPEPVLPFRAPGEAVLPVSDEGEAAFSALFARRYVALRRYVFAELRDRDAAEDVVQGAFTSMWIQYFHMKAPPPEPAHDALIFRMVQFRLASHYRDRISVAQKLQLQLSLWVERAKRWMVPTEFVDHSELAAALELAVSRMSPSERQVFLLRRESELSFDEISTLLGTKLNTVSSLMHKAQRVVRDHVTKAGFADAAVASKRGRIR